MLTAAVGLAGFVGLAVAGCATVTAGSPQVGARPAPAAAQAAGAAAGPIEQAGTGGSSGLSAVDIAAMRGSGAAATRPGAPSAADAAASGLAGSGIPSTALAAYKNAASLEAASRPTCGLSWPLLAAIGRVESNHGRFAGAVLHTDGVSTPPVIGIPLNGNGTAVIRDTDAGRLDGDAVYDRAVGPMQFIPSTWAAWGVDANHDGARDPFNVFDAAAAAADYLCAAGRDLRTTSGQVQAILSYNHSYDYVDMVMSLEKVYASGVGVTVPVLPTTGARHDHPAPTLPPVDPGKPRGAPTAQPPASSAASTSKTPVPRTSTSKPSTSGSSTSGSSTSGSSTVTSPAPSSSSTPSCDPAASSSSTPGTDTPTPGDPSGPSCSPSPSASVVSASVATPASSGP
jgi:membrane-bound lytic murein transglycosylase B